MIKFAKIVFNFFFVFNFVNFHLNALARDLRSTDKIIEREVSDLSQTRTPLYNIIKCIFDTEDKQAMFDGIRKITKEYLIQNNHSLMFNILLEGSVPCIRFLNSLGVQDELTIEEQIICVRRSEEDGRFSNRYNLLNLDIADIEDLYFDRKKILSGCFSIVFLKVFSNLLFEYSRLLTDKEIKKLLALDDSRREYSVFNEEESNMFDYLRRVQHDRSGEMIQLERSCCLIC